jgi:hypothetical protein
VVDEEAAVRGSLERSLRFEGYEVVVAVAPPRLRVDAPPDAAAALNRAAMAAGITLAELTVSNRRWRRRS